MKCLFSKCANGCIGHVASLPIHPFSIYMYMGAGRSTAGDIIHPLRAEPKTWEPIKINNDWL